MNLREALLSQAPEAVSATWVGDVPTHTFPEGAPSREVGLALIKGRKATEVREIVKTFRNTELLDEIARTDNRLRVAEGLIDSCMSAEGYATVVETHRRSSILDKISDSKHGITIQDVEEYPELGFLVNDRGDSALIRNMIAQVGVMKTVQYVAGAERVAYRTLLCNTFPYLDHQDQGINSNREVLEAAIWFMTHVPGTAYGIRLSSEVTDAEPALTEELVRVSVERGSDSAGFLPAMQMLSDMKQAPTGPIPEVPDWQNHLSRQSEVLLRWSSVRPLSLDEYTTFRLAIGQLGRHFVEVQPEVRFKGFIDYTRVTDAGKVGYTYLLNVDEPSSDVVTDMELLFRNNGRQFFYGDHVNYYVLLAPLLAPHIRVAEPGAVLGLIRTLEDAGQLGSMLTAEFHDAVADKITSAVLTLGAAARVGVDRTDCSVMENLINLHETDGLTDDQLTQVVSFNSSVDQKASNVLRLGQVDPVQLFRVYANEQSRDVSPLKAVLREADLSTGAGVLRVLQNAEPEWSRTLVDWFGRDILRFPEVAGSDFVKARTLAGFQLIHDRDVMAAVASVFTSEFGTDTAKWELAVELLPDWDESMSDLIETVHATQE